MSGQCNAPCATATERRRGMMNKFQGLIDCYDNAPYRERMRCQPATLREFPTLVERSQLLACYPVCCPAPCDPCPPACPPPCPPACPPPCPPMCMPCPPVCMPCAPMCMPCPPPCYPSPPCPPSAYEKKKDSKEDREKAIFEGRELRGGVLYAGCDCIKRNGLQHDCRRSECQGSPPCLLKPWPDCKPSGGTGTKGAPPRVSNYPLIEERCDPPAPRPRGPPQPDYEHRAGIQCQECEPPITHSKPTYYPQCPPVECPKPKLSHHPTSRIPPDNTELKGGQLLTRCDCVRRNGLQDDCRLHECGIPECLFKPDPECIPSGGRGPQGRANGLGNGNGNGKGNGNGNGNCMPMVCYPPCPSPCDPCMPCLPCPPCGPCPPMTLENCLMQCYPCGPPCRPC